MKKLLLTVVGVTIVLVGFITILCFLPCNERCCHKKDKCEMKDHDGKCSGDKEECEGNECRKEKCWMGDDGKMHKEVCVTMGDDDKMGGCSMDKGNCPMGNGQCEMGKDANGKCNMDSMMGGKCNMEKMGDGKCNMDKMQMSCGMGNSGCCCCCCKMMMMMMNGNGCGEKCEGENKCDSPKVKVRGKM